MTAQGSSRRLVYVCFFVSGAAGLIYEVVWARQLGLFLGITAFAHTAVITAYMAGLAAGSLAIGRYADRHSRPLVLYALVEVAVGLYAALTPWLFPALQALYAEMAGAAGVAGTGAHASRFGLALAALLVPTFLMGGTLPLLVRGLTRELPELGAITGRLYGINTLGATLGTFAAGYLLLPGIGVSSSIFVGVALNLAVAGAVFLMAGGRVSRQAPSEPARKPRRKGDASTRASRPEPPQPPEPLRPWVAAVVLVGFAAAGFASLLSQLAWIRALILVVGSSVYAFTITLTSFLAGIGIGSLLFGRFLAGRGRTGVGDGLALAAGLAVFIGFAVLLSLLAIGKTPGLFLHAFEAGLQESFLLFQALIFGLNFLIMLLPTLGMGALFPLITVLWTRNAAAVGGGVGTAYAVNTAGTILGSVLGGLVLLPTLGVHGSLILAAGIYLAVALGFWMVRPTPVRAALRYALATGVLLGFAAAVVLLPPWNRVLMSAGVYYDPDRYLRQGAENPLTGGGKDEQLVYYAEGLDGTVAVFDRQSYRTLVINGKVDASSSGDMPTQVLLGRLPMLMHPAPRRGLIVGLGSGVTAAAVVAAGKALDSLTVLEISPEVVEASRFFAPENGDVLSDPRVDLALADARNYLMAAPGHYDLIISEPSNPWISGISNLFTRDFFELARSRLAPGGLMVQWFHLYGMSEADLQSVLRTYGSVFPHVSVWTPLLGDLILVGSDAPHALDYGLLAEALARDDGPLSLESIRMEKPRDLVRTFLMGGPELTRYASGVPLNTDDRPRIEFNAPRNLYATTVTPNLLSMARHQGGRYLPVPLRGGFVRTLEGLDAPLMGLRIRTPPSVGDADWQSLWTVRRVAETGEGDQDRLGIGDERALQWQEGPSKTLVTALWLPSEPQGDGRRAYLQDRVRRHAVEQGRLRLPGGTEGDWLVARDPKSGQVELGLTWTCPALDGGVDLYWVQRLLPDLEPGNWRPAILDLADRFRCLH